MRFPWSKKKELRKEDVTPDRADETAYANFYSEDYPTFEAWWKAVGQAEKYKGIMESRAAKGGRTRRNRRKRLSKSKKRSRK